MKQQLFIIIFIFFCLVIVNADTAEAKKMFAPDLTVTRYTQFTGDITISNTGSKNSPVSGFDVMLYYVTYNGAVYKQTYHATRSIAPGYSRKFSHAFSGNDRIAYGLIRVNPYKRFQEWSYDNNVRYFSLQKVKIPSYTATEQSRFLNNPDYGFYYGYDFTSGGSGNFINGGYSPLLSTNPIATGYNHPYLYKHSWRWEWITQDLYVNALQLYYPYPNGKKYRSNYLIISGVANNPHMHMYVDIGYGKHLTYNAAKNQWEMIISSYKASKLRTGLLIKIYSDRTGQDGTNDIMNFVNNVRVTSYYIKNSWSWSW